jgi:hypothetical protein
MQQEADLTIKLGGKSAKSTGHLRPNHLVSAPPFTGQTLQELELIFLQPADVAAY